MVDKPDKPDKPLDENESLVKALESIKSLLATSETKLSQARESISLASAHSLKMTREVPVLDDVIVPGKTIPETGPAPKADLRSETKPVKSISPAELQTFRTELEKELHTKLTAYAAQLEDELKAKIQEYLDKPSN